MGNSKVTLVKHAFFKPQLNAVNKVVFNEESFNLNQLQAEYTTLYQIFLSNKEKHTQETLEIASLVNEICSILTSYYRTDYVSSELKKLEKQKKELEHFIAECQHKITSKSGAQIVKHPPNFAARVRDRLQKYNSITTGLNELSTDIGALNANRSRFGNSRTLALTALNFIENSPLSDFIQELNAIFGNQSSFVDGILLLDSTREILAIIGIGLYSARLSLNMILLIKHLIEAAMNDNLSVKKVLMQELQKRGFIMASDFVWGSVSVLTNYSIFFHISSQAVSAMSLCFLVFDVVWLLAQWYLEFVQHNHRLQEFNSQLEEATDFEKKIIQRQIDILNDEWDAQCHFYIINILAANILATTFAISLLFTGPLAIAAMALCSMLANALYNTSTDYKQYQKAKITLNREIANGAYVDDEHHKALLQSLEKECNESYLEFWKSLGFNVGGIAFIITAAVICWPVALVLTIAVIGYQLSGTYQQYYDNTKDQISHDVYRLFSPQPSLEQSSAAPIPALQNTVSLAPI